MANIEYEKVLRSEETGIEGLKVLDLSVHGDSRGWFKENWQREKMAKGLGLPDLRWVQNNISFNLSAGATRGIHAEPWNKFISVATGSVFGAWVDLREGSPTYGRVYTCVLDPSKAIFVPRGVGNSYQALEDGTAYTANSENNVKALKLLQDMVNNGSMSANASFAAADELQAFANQTCAVSFCWNYANYTQYAAQTQFTPFAMAFPSDDGKPELEMAGPYGFGVFNNKDEAKIEAAKKFVQFVCDDQTVGVEAVKATGFFPVHSDWGDVYTGDADAETRAPFALMSDYLGRYYNLTGGWTEQRGYWWPMLTEIMTTGADVQTAADKYAAQANANIG